MSDALCSLLYRLDYGRDLVWTHAEVEHWAEGELDHLVAAGLLIPDQPSQRVICPECGDVVDVLILGSPHQDGETACLLCSECGPQRVPLAQVGCYRLEFSEFLRGLCKALGIDSRWNETVPGRIWKLGKFRCAGASRSAYLARHLQWRDARDVIEQADFPPGSIVYVPAERPRRELRIERLPHLVPLLGVLKWGELGLSLDMAHVEDQLALASSAGVTDDSAPRKRDSRLSAIGLVKQELIEHLRAARDYARETQSRTGTPLLLPRPTRAQLAKQLGVHRTTVSRCLEDSLAPELRVLWELATDVDRILAYRPK
jgi:hypothetical protein